MAVIASKFDTGGGGFLGASGMAAAVIASMGCNCTGEVATSDINVSK